MARPAAPGAAYAADPLWSRPSRCRPTSFPYKYIMRTSIVTGGARFIGCNFVRLALRQTQALVVVLDKLTCSGSLLNRRDTQNHPSFAFAKGDMTDRAAIKGAQAGSGGGMRGGRNFSLGIPLGCGVPFEMA